MHKTTFYSVPPSVLYSPGVSPTTCGSERNGPFSLRVAMEAHRISFWGLFNAQISICWAISPLVTSQSPTWWRWGKGRFRAPHPAFLANTVFGFRVAAVVQLNKLFVMLDVALSLKPEVNQRLLPNCLCATPAAPTGVEGNDADHHGL